MRFGGDTGNCQFRPRLASRQRLRSALPHPGNSNEIPMFPTSFACFLNIFSNMSGCLTVVLVVLLEHSQHLRKHLGVTKSNWPYVWCQGNKLERMTFLGQSLWRVVLRTKKKQAHIFGPLRTEGICSKGTCSMFFFVFFFF